ncbi:hypothetical protein ACKU27_23270 [Sphingobium yanoikuyae]|uniref:hypothetical protein n=1 Tax=Sphingobium yanoikuyae TaxID=13690 RepID=UPI002FDEAFB1
MRQLDRQKQLARFEMVKWMMLWQHFLVLSPSYELARRFRAGDLDGSESLPSDFDNVLAVYDDLGEAKFSQFGDWWMRNRYRNFGFAGDKVPSITRLGVVSDKDATDLGQAAADYINGDWSEQGQPAAIIAAIPAGLAKAQVMRQLSALLDELPKTANSRQHDANAKYALFGAKLHRDSVKRYRDVLGVRARHPKATLWQVGAMARFSRQYRGIRSSKDGTFEDRKNLKELTSRALNRGRMIAENAARGIFPSYVKCEHALPMDYPHIERLRLEAMAARLARREPV